jgi:hypothetical protein
MGCVTYYHDMDSGELRKIDCLDNLSPFLFQRQLNPNPRTPYKPGLPIGEYIYYSLYLGRILSGDILPGNDVKGLLLVPLDTWEMLNKSSLEDVLYNHELIERQKIPRKTKLFIRTDESFNMVIPLLRKHKELIINS